VADADDPAKMPAIGVATEDFNDNTQGNIVTFGNLIGFNTSTFSVNDELYVSTTGTLTATRPNASNTEVQKVAKVVRSHPSNGQLFIMGAGRSNDVPNAIITNSINLSSTTTVDSVLDEDTMASDSATALATQQSIKAYVDSQIGSNNELSEILTNGNTTGGNDISFADNDKAIFGAGSDLQIYHDGTSNIFAGNIFIDGTDASASIASPAALNLKAGDASNEYSTLRLATSADGSLAMIGAKATTTGAYPNSVGQLELAVQNGASTNTILTATATGVDVTGVITTDGLTTSADINFGDNDKAIFGAGSDLEIYHDGADSIITEQGTGSLYLGADSTIALTNAAVTQNKAQFITGGAVNLFYNNALKLATTATGVDVTGTVTADGLTVDGIVDISDASEAKLSLVRTGARRYDVTVDGSSNFAITDSALGDRLNIAGNGDISFYEDTGTTAKFFWDASAERLGIGTSSPDRPLEVVATNTTMKITGSGVSSTGIVFETNGTERKQIGIPSGDTALAFYSDAGSSEAMRINSSGNVGIGDSAPSQKLNVAGNIMLEGSDQFLYLTNVGTGNNGQYIRGTQSNGEVRCHTTTSGSFTWEINGSQKMQIDSSGNVLVGKTTSGYTVDGFQARQNGETNFSNTSSPPVTVNRNGTDGSFISFYKSGGAVGTIGSSSGVLVVDGGTNYTGCYYGASAWIPRDNGAVVDNAVDLGNLSNRFDDIYATNGTIQTSDANEKQQIAALTDAEITAAKAISQLFKTFKWNSAVTEKGDAARTHAGVIAQDVQAAMTAAGLDAGDYAFFISSTWWETQTEVPAVEAVEAVLDENGNVVTEAVEAQEAYTRTDTYETAEEALEGATKRTRLGIRYPELLAFVGAATEQRLANIETRLTALETAE
jgi:hypothetical protein